MGITIRRIAVRFAMLLVLAAVVPLVVYGFVSIQSLQRGTRDSVVAGNENVAARAAEEIRRYVVTDAEILKALAADLQNTGLDARQQDQILKNYILQFHEFREITLFDEAGSPIASSSVGKPRVQIPKNGSPLIDSVTMSPIKVDEDLLPTTVFAIRLTKLNQPAGWLVGDFSLEEMWRMVDRIKIGDHGFALVIAPDGELIAHGDPDKKALVAQSRNMSGHPLVVAGRAQKTAGSLALEYAGDDGRMELGVSSPIASLGWTVVVEQPTGEAFATATQLRRQLIYAASFALIAMMAVGVLFSRRYFIKPIHKLKEATAEVASGRLETRVDIQSKDEFGDLGESFNTMANRLVQLQEDVKRQERFAMFGRVASGLVHDLLHPIQNVGNNTRLLLREAVDDDTRLECGRIIDRELNTIKHFLDDLRNIVKPKPVERFPLDVNVSVSETVESMKPEGERHGVTVESQYAEGPLVIEGDRFALGRVYRNLITNAIQATQPGGRVTITTARAGDRVAITVADTGSGIAPDRLATIFDEFVTTKRKGLGLGLAVTKRIVEQLDGTITVESEVGRGTSFTLRFPARDDRAAQAAAS
ncbi:MAG TPA: sensor histidine kinase [Vicinamibacterales bacterium]|nr:sensor histidine kinase [Vicinamibacterales bacterium]